MSTKPLGILVVEDDEEDFLIVRSLLGDIYGDNVTVTWIPSWDNALEALEQSSHDVCLLDFFLGERDGAELTTMAKSNGSTVPIILLTANGKSDVSLQAMVNGAVDCLDKNGLTAAPLEDAIRRAIDGQRQERRKPKSRSDVPKILLIDDDEDEFLLTEDYLSEIYGQELSLDWVPSIEGAMGSFRDAAHDVYLLDYRLGECNGIDIIKEATALGVTAPFILLTGQDSRELDLEAMSAGAADYLVKGEMTAPLLDRAIRYAMERTRSESKLSYLAQFDQLTGLANRRLFKEHLENTIKKADRRQSGVAVLLLDLDRFKIINDTYGHDMGDKLLQAVSERIRYCIRGDDLVARLGGDEFTVVIDDVTDPQVVARCASRILYALRKPFFLGNLKINTSTSIGIAIYPYDVDDIEGLIKSADAAMYKAKDEGADNFQFYTMDMHVHASKFLRLEKEMHGALEQNQFELWYQPQVNLRTACISGFEALIRWQNPEYGLVRPDEFIFLAEECGLIIPIGAWVIDTACSQAKEWQELHRDMNLCVAVNVSARQFQEANLVDVVKTALSKYDLNGDNLEIEITESSILRDPVRVSETLDELQTLGVGVSLDDFGTGYSSLNHLKSFPGATVKIDKSFTQRICEDKRDASIVKGIIDMAHNLGMLIVAEGVEEEPQLSLLREYGCDTIQGYFFSKPVRAEKITAEFLARKLTGSETPNPNIVLAAG